MNYRRTLLCKKRSTSNSVRAISYFCLTQCSTIFHTFGPNKSSLSCPQSLVLLYNCFKGRDKRSEMRHHKYTARVVSAVSISRVRTPLRLPIALVLCVMLPATMIEHKLTQFRCSQRASVRVIGGVSNINSGRNNESWQPSVYL